MDAPVIKTLMRRVKHGEENALMSLRGHLANRLVYVPRIGVKTESGQGTRIRIVMREEKGRKCIPIFTSEEGYLQWRRETGRRGDFFSILGGDLCTAVDTDAWIEIDPGDEDSVILSPEDSQAIALIGADEETTEFSTGSPVEKEPGTEVKGAQGAAYEAAGFKTAESGESPKVEDRTDEIQENIVELPEITEVKPEDKKAPDADAEKEHKVSTPISRVMKIVGDVPKESVREDVSVQNHAAHANKSHQSTPEGKGPGFLKSLFGKFTA